MHMKRVENCIIQMLGSGLEGFCNNLSDEGVDLFNVQYMHCTAPIVKFIMYCLMSFIVWESLFV